MSDAKPENARLTAELLRGMAATLGVTLSDERAAALTSQAEPHFELLQALDTIADPATEPAAEFRLDGWTRRIDD